MTDKELIQALRHCGKFENIEDYSCVGCPAEGEGCGGAFLLAADRLEALLAENERSRWVSVSERLPENDERVLALCKDGVIHDMSWNYPMWEWRDRTSGDAYFEEFATHWMPPPSTEGVD